MCKTENRSTAGDQCRCDDAKPLRSECSDLLSVKLGPCQNCFDYIKPCRCSLRKALEEIMVASKPYLKRKKMTPRKECSSLNSAYDKAKNVLGR